MSWKIKLKNGSVYNDQDINWKDLRQMLADENTEIDEVEIEGEMPKIRDVAFVSEIDREGRPKKIEVGSIKGAKDVRRKLRKQTLGKSFIGFFQHKIGYSHIKKSGSIVQEINAAQEMGFVRDDGSCRIVSINNYTGLAEEREGDIFEMGMNVDLHPIDQSKLPQDKLAELKAKLNG